MTATAYLQNYFVLNISIIVACLIFFILKAALKFFNLRAKSIYMRRWAQILLVISFMTPTALLVVPRKTFSNIEFHAWTPTSELARGGHSKGSSREGINPRESRVILSSSTGFHFFQLTKHLRPSFLLGLILLALLFYSVGFFVKLRRLRSVLMFGTPLRRIGRVSIIVSDEVVVPFSVLLFRKAWVVIPVNILRNNQDLKIALKHELQHHRHGDTRWAFYVEILACLFCLNPAFFLLKRNITEFQELACDEALVTKKKISCYEYGSCLVRVAALAIKEHGAPRFVASTSFAVNSEKPAYLKSFLGKRIEALALMNMRRKFNLSSAVIMFLGVLATALFAYGAQINFVSPKLNPINPGSVIIDPVYQDISEKVLARALANEGAKSGFVIVAEPVSGRILAVANRDTTQRRSSHWALSQFIEPASIAKTLVVAEALNKNVTSPQEMHPCENGSYRYGNRVYHDWKKEGWASLTTEETITNSSDICSMKIGEKLGAEGLREMLVDFGFGSGGTASVFAEARSGQLPPPDDETHPRLVPYVSAGYGFRITPLEMVQAYGAIANGGYLMMPKPANEVGGQIIRRVLSPEAAEETKKILEQVVIKGTAKKHGQSDFYTTAGKTATSYAADLTKIDWLGGDQKANFAAFIGFAPVSKPRVEVFVGIRDPKSRDGAHGAAHAAPIFREVVEKVLEQMNVPHDKGQVNNL